MLSSGCGSVWLERLVWDQEAAGSNPVTPIFYSYEPGGAGGGKAVGELAHRQLFPTSDTCGDSRKARKAAGFSSVPGGKGEPVHRQPF